MDFDMLLIIVDKLKIPDSDKFINYILSDASG